MKAGWFFGVSAGLALVAGLWIEGCAGTPAKSILPKTLETSTASVSSDTSELAEAAPPGDAFALEAPAKDASSQTAKVKTPSARDSSGTAITSEPSPDSLQCVEAPPVDPVAEVFARRYRERHCALCSDGVAVEPIVLPGRPRALDQILERTAAGVRGKRRRVALYYFYIPCKPCDRLLPDIHRAMKRRKPQDIEIIPIIDAPWDEVNELLAEIRVKFPDDLVRIPGVYRDAAKRGSRLRDFRKGTPVTIVFSGPELSRVEVLYGKDQTRFWQRAASGRRL